MNTIKLSKRIIFDGYKKSITGFDYKRAFQDGLLSDIDFIEYYKDDIRFWDDVVILSPIKMNILFEHFGKWLMHGSVYRMMSLNVINPETLTGIYKIEEMKKLTIKRSKEYLDEYEKYKR